MADGDLWNGAPSPCARCNLGLVFRVGVGVHQRDGQRLETLGLNRIERCIDGGVIGNRFFNGAVSEHPLVDLNHQIVKLLWQDDVFGEDVGTRLVAKAQRITKPFGDDQCGWLPFALQQSVGRHRGAHFHRGNLLRGHTLAGFDA
jgi:hypothetical protein